MVLAATVAVLAAAAGLAWFLLTVPSTDPRAGSARRGDPVLRLPRATTSTTAVEIVVHVAGAVARPGLVRLPSGARVADALAAAGGPAQGADLDRLNLAAPLADGTRLYVPFVGQPVPADVGLSTPGTDAKGPTAVVDLNTATATELESLPGIGPATAQAILDYRARRGRFRSVEELLAVRGIGPAKLAALRGRVRV